MRPDPADPGRARLLTAVFAFVVTLVIGGIAAGILTATYRAQVEESARRDALVIGTSVARALAQQFEKAARYGIPLKLLPGVEAHLEETVTGTPGITQIILRGPDGRELRSAMDGDPGIDSTSADVVVDGNLVATVEVGTNPSALSNAFSNVAMKAAVVVFICAALAALVSGLLVGLALDRAESRLTEGLNQVVAGDFDWDTGAGRYGFRYGAVGRAFRAMTLGNRHVRERRAVFEAYAEELLAVDFDGSLRPEVESLKHDVLAPPVASDKERAL